MTRRPQGQEQFVVRFPDGVRAKLKAWAAQEHRSANGQIIHIISRALEERETGSGATDANQRPAAGDHRNSVDALSD